LTSSDLFSPIFVPAELREAVSDRAWLQAMLDFEAALAAAEADAGVIPAEAAGAIATACRADSFDAAALGAAGRGAGNPAAPLVAALTDAVEGDAAGYVHWGATSQDVTDSAAMLVARDALRLVEAELDGVAAGCAALAEAHRDTPMVARTLMQQALPTTFGLKAAGWLVGVLGARRQLAVLRAGLPAQLGGAAGTLAPLGERGTEVAEGVARRLELAAPALPWHTDRRVVAELGGSLALAAGAVEKLALDVVLMSQTEVGELAEPSGDGRGGSSTMPQKRNPVGSALAIACARRVRGAAGVLLEAMAGEHERAAGAWQSEWQPLSDALALTGGAAAHGREVVDGLEVRADRMRANLDAGGGLPLAESVMFALAEQLGRSEAKRVVGEAARRAAEGGGSLRDELLAASAGERLGEAELDRALDPAGYLGSAGAFVDRALQLYQGAS
jgi:3-carboxy-cis,cis-muconate cycloisomerase